MLLTVLTGEYVVWTFARTVPEDPEYPAPLKIGSHKTALDLLFPLKHLGGMHDQDFTIAGAKLDDLQISGAGLLAEIFPNTAQYMLSDWERLFEITPRNGSGAQSRRNDVLRRVRAVGGMTPAYFIALAAMLGYVVTIEELPPNAPGYGEESVHVWRVRVAGGAKALKYFRAGQSHAGEPLVTWDTEDILEDMINELKPAHTEAYFVYGS